MIWGCVDPPCTPFWTIYRSSGLDGTPCYGPSPSVDDGVNTPPYMIYTPSLTCTPDLGVYLGVSGPGPFRGHAVQSSLANRYGQLHTPLLNTILHTPTVIWGLYLCSQTPSGRSPYTRGPLVYIPPQTVVGLFPSPTHVRGRDAPSCI